MQTFVGKRDPLQDAHGRAGAADLRAGVAQIQRKTSVLPPETVGKPKVVGMGVDKHVQVTAKGDVMREKSFRYGAANAAILRREMTRRGLEDPRWTTKERAAWINRAAGVNQPTLKPGAQGVELVGTKNKGSHVVPVVHRKTEPGFDEKGKACERVKGQDRFDENGKHVVEVREQRRSETTVEYHCSDLNIAKLPPERVRPGDSADRAKRWMDANKADKPDPVEIQRDMVKNRVAVLKADVQKGGVTETLGTGDEARFSINKKGEMTIAIPPPEKFQDLSAQATSVAVALAHANLAIGAQRIAAAGQTAGTPNEAAEDRLKAYAMPPSKQASSEAYAKADLVAHTVAVHTVTALALEYRPPAATTHKSKIESWAKTLESPGGYADISRQVTAVTKRQDDLKAPRQDSGTPADRFPTRGRVAESTPGRSADDIGARAATAARREMRAGGDPSVGAPAQRPEAPGGATTPATPEKPDRSGR